MPSINPSFRMKPSVFLDFENKKKPKGFEELSIDDRVMVVLQGRVKAMHSDEDSSGMRVEYTRLEVVNDTKPATMTDVLDQLRGESA